MRNIVDFLTKQNYRCVQQKEGVNPMDWHLPFILSLLLSPFLKLSPTSIGIDDAGKDLLAFGALDDMVDNIINPHLIDLMMAKGTGAFY